MQSTITLTITTGKLSGKQYIFDSPTTCLIGRNDDCYLSIPDEIDKRVSRYHCLLKDGGYGKGKGLVHRDLKPSNIFLFNINGKLTAKIGDYGLAKSFDLAGLSGQTLTKSIGGTPGFIPRQQALKFKESKPEVDVWAAAASLYNMLTGYVPRNFCRDPFMDVIENDPIPILQRNPHIPPKLAKVIDLALVEKPEIHFKNADDFKKVLLSI